MSLKRQPSLKLDSTEDGLHLAGSVLWLDSESSGQLSFLSSALQKIRPNVPQVIATEETIKILETVRKKPNSLVCQYNRPFSIGRLKMELLPSGCVLGGASLYVETSDSKLLYSPFLLTHRLQAVRQMQLKKAKTMVLGAYHPDPNSIMPNRKKEKERLLSAIKESISQNKYPIIFCPPLGIAQELTEIITAEEIPLAVHQSIAKINKIYNLYGAKLKNYSAYSPKYTKNKVVLFPSSSNFDRLSLKRPVPEGKIFYIEETQGESNSPVVFRDISERYFLNTTADGAELKEVVTAVDPKELFFIGPYAKRYIEAFKTNCPKIKPLFPNDQPTLF